MAINATAIGAEAMATASNQVRVGNTSVTSIGGQVGWTTFSDGRFKRNLREDVPGVDFINKLNPITYNVDADAVNKAIRGDASSPANATQSGNRITGFVAQDVEKAAGALGYDFSGVDKPKSEKDFYGLRYSEFVVPLVKAVQELSTKNEELAKKAARVDELEQRLLRLEALLKNCKQ